MRGSTPRRLVPNAELRYFHQLVDESDTAAATRLVMTASIEATHDSTERIATRILNRGYRVPSPLRIATTEALNHREAQIFPFGAPVFDKTNRVDAIKYAGFAGGEATDTSIELPAGTYAVITQCKEGASTNPYVTLGPVAQLTLTGAPAPGGGGSANLGLGDLLSLFSGFGS
ncbi:hypothetical protein RW1_094_04090 [Rhodococcus wratislaviensis NBRC 100605]|uniref:Uncharacterized protein n=1 Tax=Rhodococcus wratislaviensis NBRC 100605 TaxID=1219028 RepID=X0QFL3_RHOWR|nr:hypothetical protein RW1_094_04090 [Rhodococcus wratislaviensis NBRC 100605]